ncbi:MAG: FAD-dependent oxidoreductase [Anaerolineae bacterium]|nr:FAD-dependent oxidoreductase [Anaerolineae bacterium]
MDGRSSLDASSDASSEALVLVIGAGPAGLFTAQALASDGMDVILLNRDFKPGGLAEYGIYHSKHRIKSVLRNQFQKILEMPEVTYFGNVTVSNEGDLTLAALREMGFSAIVVAVGAQGTKWLGLPGEDLSGVYHAKDLIYYYNRLPPFSERSFDIGRRAALIGVGNVMADIARWLVRDLKIDEVIAVARRGPVEIKFTRQEFEHIAANLDVADFEREIERVRSRMAAVDQNPDEAKAFVLSALDRAEPPVSNTVVRFRFLASPSRMLGDGEGRVAGLEVENTELVRNAEGVTRPVRTGTTDILDVDTVIFCIGDRVSEDFGLPTQWFSFVKHPDPHYAVGGISFEAFDPACGEALPGVFIAGWAREASKGQVALARKDAQGCAAAVKGYLADRPVAGDAAAARRRLMVALGQLDKPVITTADALRLEEIEAERAAAAGEEAFRFDTNAAMLEALGLTLPD